MFKGEIIDLPLFFYIEMIFDPCILYDFQTAADQSYRFKLVNQIGNLHARKIDQVNAM